MTEKAPHDVHNTEEEIEPMDAYTHLKEIVAYCSRRLAEVERLFSPSPKTKRISDIHKKVIIEDEDGKDEPGAELRDWEKWHRELVEGFTGIKSK